MKEHTRAFFNNEVDVHISLNKVLRHKFFFDQENQELRANQNLEGEHIGKYVTSERVFDCKKFSLDFMECLESALGKVDLSQGFRIGDKHRKFTMEPHHHQLRVPRHLQRHQGHLHPLPGQIQHHPRP